MGIRRTLTTATAVLLLTVLPATAAPAAPGVGATVRKMTLREKVGQLVMFGVGSTSLSPQEKDMIKRFHLGGVILFRHNYNNREQLKNLSGKIQRWARRGTKHRIGALISVDQEGGVVKRFPDMPPWYSHPQIGASGDEGLAFTQGRKTGRALRRAGVNMNLAPVADIDHPPHVMRSRSFGSRTNLVARMSKAFARGMQKRRTAAALKHFPGFGGADRNSDDGPAYVRRSRWQLRNVDAVPFHRAIAGGARVMMLSHGMYVNDGGNRPASVNPYIAKKRLRREFDFKGVAITDALNAVAWHFGGSTSQACRATIRAGADLALITGNVHQARSCADRIRRAVRSGNISRARIDQAVTRILKLKVWLRAFEP